MRIEELFLTVKERSIIAVVLWIIRQSFPTAGIAYGKMFQNRKYALYMLFEFNKSKILE